MDDVTRPESVRSDGSFAAYCKHNHRITVLYRLIGMSNDIQATGAGRGDGVAGSMQIEQLSKKDSRGIANQIQVELRRDLRWINCFGPVLRRLTIGSFSGLCWSDSGGKCDAPMVAYSS